MYALLHRVTKTEKPHRLLLSPSCMLRKASSTGQRAEVQGAVIHTPARFHHLRAKRSDGIPTFLLSQTEWPEWRQLLSAFGSLQALCRLAGRGALLSHQFKSDLWKLLPRCFQKLCLVSCLGLLELKLTHELNHHIWTRRDGLISSMQDLFNAGGGRLEVGVGSI